MAIIWGYICEVHRSRKPETTDHKQDNILELSATEAEESPKSVTSIILSTNDKFTDGSNDMTGVEDLDGGVDYLTSDEIKRVQVLFRHTLRGHPAKQKPALFTLKDEDKSSSYKSVYNTICREMNRDETVS